MAAAAASPTSWPANRVRQTFVDFFVKKYNHVFVPSSAVIPARDPTLLFTNAGMNQFKDIIAGTADPNTEFGRLKRAANSQICIRAGGKHNDLEDVGRDTYHHTMFEMLGNWSFGDYFKKEAIEWAWELLTVVYGLPKDRLYVTYFEGNTALNIPADLETRDLWRGCGVADDHILTGNMKDNFWEMGDTGPCGPCTEVHFDRLGGRNAAQFVNNDDPMVIEIWNNVFMQFNRLPDRSLQVLPAQHVDTGMGLERLVSIMQNKLSNYDTDTWLPLFAAIQRETKFPTPYEAFPAQMPPQDAVVAYRAIADHIRCITAALSDGAVPDNVGRGFVLRRIIRRAVRYGAQFLGAETGFFARLVPAVVESLGSFFPHLANPLNIRRVQTIIADEEESFAKTWKTGLKHFEVAKGEAVKAGSTAINPSDVFVLHDRYGFPADLTALLAEKEGMTVDMKAFEEEMKRNQSQGGRVAAARTFFDAYQMDDLQKKKVPTTNDNAKYVWEPISSKILAVFDKAAGAFVDAANDAAKEYGLVLESSNFYAECGGQLYDTGAIEKAGSRFNVAKVLVFGGYVAHIGSVAAGASLSVGDAVKLNVDYSRRLPIAANHTATHQLNKVLRDVLQFGHPESFTEVHQRGSLVNDDQLRFDFSWNAKLENADVVKVQTQLNEAIQQGLQVYAQEVPLQKALEINTIRCMFDERYPDPVTVVCVGKPVTELLANPTNAEWSKYSIELCGGTHVKTLTDVQEAVIVSEDGLSKGVRRMVIYTRDAARRSAAEGVTLRAELSAIIAAADMDFDEKTKAMGVLSKRVGDSSIPLVAKNALRDDIEAAVRVQLNAKKAHAATMKDVGTTLGAKFAESLTAAAKFAVLDTADVGAERDYVQFVIDGILSKRPDVATLVAGVDVKRDKAIVIATMTDAHIAKGLSAVNWIKDVCGGKGGGKPGTAQAGLTASTVSAAVAGAKASADRMQATL